MARAYSIDLRERAAAVEADGLSRHAAVARFGVAASSAIRWVRRFRETGGVAPGRIGGRKPRVLRGEQRDWLLKRATRDFTLRGLAAELAERGVKVDYRQVWELVHTEGPSFKKSVSPAEQLRPKEVSFVNGIYGIERFNGKLSAQGIRPSDSHSLSRPRGRSGGSIFSLYRRGVQS